MASFSHTCLRITLILRASPAVLAVAGAVEGKGGREISSSGGWLACQRLKGRARMK